MRTLVLVGLLVSACDTQPSLGTPPSSARSVPSVNEAQPALHPPTNQHEPACGRCESGLGCMKVGEVARCVTMLGGLPQLRAGALIGIRGASLEVFASCTKKGCGKSGCCNQCSEGTMYLRWADHVLKPAREGAELRCRAGNECELGKNCPFKPGRYDVVGKLVETGNPGAQWELDWLAMEPAIF